MFSQVLAYVVLIFFILLINILPVSSIFHGISPYTGMTFTCPRVGCQRVPESSSTIASMASGAAIAMLLWALIFYALSEGIATKVQQCIWHTSRRNIDPVF